MGDAEGAGAGGTGRAVKGSIFHFSFIICHFPLVIPPLSQMPNAKCQMTNEKWKMENGKCVLLPPALPNALTQTQDQPHPAVPSTGQKAILCQEEKHREKKAGITLLRRLSADCCQRFYVFKRADRSRDI